MKKKRLEHLVDKKPSEKKCPFASVMKDKGSTYQDAIKSSKYLKKHCLKCGGYDLNCDIYRENMRYYNGPKRKAS